MTNAATRKALQDKLEKMSILFEALRAHHSDLINRFDEPEEAAIVLFPKLIADEGDRLVEEVSGLMQKPARNAQAPKSAPVVRLVPRDA